MYDTQSIVATTSLRACRYFESTDLDDTRERIAGVLAPHSLTPDRSLRTMASRMELLDLGGLGIGTLRYGGAMSVDVPVMAESHLLIFCLAGSAQARAGRTDIAIDRRRGFACNPGQAFRARFSDDAEQFFVRLDRRVLSAHSGLHSLWLDPQIDLTRPGMAPWEALLRHLLADAETIALVRSQPAIARDYERLLTSLLLAGHPHSDAAAVRRRSIAPATVRRAEAYIRAHAVEPITLADIADAAGVPARTLLDGFRRFRDLSPMRLLREIRLDRTRVLLRERRAGDGIAAIAQACGFGHPGRFAQDYFERFGEKPSETLVAGPPVARGRQKSAGRLSGIA